MSLKSSGEPFSTFLFYEKKKNHIYFQWLKIRGRGQLWHSIMKAGCWRFYPAFIFVPSFPFLSTIFLCQRPFHPKGSICIYLGLRKDLLLVDGPQLQYMKRLSSNSMDILQPFPGQSQHSRSCSGNISDFLNNRKNSCIQMRNGSLPILRSIHKGRCNLKPLLKCKRSVLSNLCFLFPCLKGPEVCK